MIKLELAHCCMSCDFADIRTEERRLPLPAYVDEALGFSFRYNLEKLQIIGCSHRRVCADYLKEPLKALPADKLFGSED